MASKPTMTSRSHSDPSGACRSSNVNDLFPTDSAPPFVYAGPGYTKNTDYWPQRPRVEFFASPKKSKVHGPVRLPEVNVPCQHVMASREGTIEFSTVVSTWILQIISPSNTESENPREPKRFSIPELRRNLSSRTKSISVIFHSSRKPVLDFVEIDGYNLPPESPLETSIANVHFAECLISKGDYVVEKGKIKIKQSAAKQMLDRAIFWIDEKHWILKSIHWLKALPKEEPFLDRGNIDILRNHIVNGRWFWITKLRAISYLRYGPITVNGHTVTQRTAERKLKINTNATADLHGARMAWFSLLPENPEEGLKKFCRKDAVEDTDLVRYWQEFNLLEIYLSYPDNGKFIEEYRQKLPTVMERYKKITVMDYSELQRVVEEEEDRGLMARFRDSKRVKLDPVLMRMAKKRLEMKWTSCACSHNCRYEGCPVRTAKDKKWQLVKTALMEYLKEKALHDPGCYRKYWPKETSVSGKGKEVWVEPQKNICGRCWMLEWREDQALEILETRSRSREVFWDPEHQSKDMPEGWCCHKTCLDCRNECRKDCKEKRSKCSALKCQVYRSNYKFVCEGRDKEWTPLRIVSRWSKKPDNRLRRIYPPPKEWTSKQDGSTRISETATGSPNCGNSQILKSGGSWRVVRFSKGLLRKLPGRRHVAQVQHQIQ